MTPREIVRLRDDAFDEIVGIYKRTTKADKGESSTIMRLHAAVEMHKAAIRFLDILDDDGVMYQSTYSLSLAIEGVNEAMSEHPSHADELRAMLASLSRMHAEGGSS